MAALIQMILKRGFSTDEASTHTDAGLDDPRLDDSSQSFDEAAAADEEQKQVSSAPPKDIIVVYILPRVDTLLQGAQINSAVQALGLSFGEMKYFPLYK